ncbi:MAG TPA: permease prefix domain 1-containing protein [Ardenticatenaceae bacterium]|nr:permease prefix domain 1-containing protein [Ardenticatenaceae bacterium]
MNAGDRYLDRLAASLPLDRDQQRAILVEVSDHLTVSAEWWQQQGLNEDDAWERAVAEFGPVEEIAGSFAETRRGWGTGEALAAAALPVLLTLVLKWLLLPALDLPRSWGVLTHPALLSTAVLLLLVPLAWRVQRWRYGLAVWFVFWFFTIVGAGP